MPQNIICRGDHAAGDLGEQTHTSCQSPVKAGYQSTSEFTQSGCILPNRQLIVLHDDFTPRFNQSAERVDSNFRKHPPATFTRPFIIVEQQNAPDLEQSPGHHGVSHDVLAFVAAVDVDRIDRVRLSGQTMVRFSSSRPHSSTCCSTGSTNGF